MTYVRHILTGLALVLAIGAATALSNTSATSLSRAEVDLMGLIKPWTCSNITHLVPCNVQSGIPCDLIDPNTGRIYRYFQNYDCVNPLRME